MHICQLCHEIICNRKNYFGKSVFCGFCNFALALACVTIAAPHAWSCKAALILPYFLCVHTRPTTSARESEREREKEREREGERDRERERGRESAMTGRAGSVSRWRSCPKVRL
jgi:hypothetical protein